MFNVQWVITYLLDLKPKPTTVGPLMLLYFLLIYFCSYIMTLLGLGLTTPWS